MNESIFIHFYACLAQDGLCIIQGSDVSEKCYNQARFPLHFAKSMSWQIFRKESQPVARHGVGWGGNVRGRFSNFSKSVEKLWGGGRGGGVDFH